MSGSADGKSRITHNKTVMKRLANFRFAKFVVVESLGRSEVSTGQLLADYVSTLDSFVDLQIGIEIHDCQSAQRLKDVLAKITMDAREHRETPILHFECHGSQFGNGLVLASGEEIPWSELAPILDALNRATKFNLLVFLSACNAFYFIERMTAIEPSPVYAIVAPSDEVNPGEVLSGTRTYYRTLFGSGDAGFALKELKAERLRSGSWFGKTAEEWFEEIVVNYVRSHCSPKEIAERARSLYQTQPSTKPRKGVGALRRGLRHSHKQFVQKYFDRCFLTAEIPFNADRFEELRKRVDRRVKDILSEFDS
jgi:hypothetical protein